MNKRSFSGARRKRGTIMKKITLWVLLVSLLLGLAVPGMAAETKSINPMLDPFEV